MTPTQRKLVEAAVLALTKLPLRDRAEPFEVFLRDYEKAVELAHPEMSRDQVREQGAGYALAVAERLREVDKATGGKPMGRA